MFGNKRIEQLSKRVGVLEERLDNTRKEKLMLEVKLEMVKEKMKENKEKVWQWLEIVEDNLMETLKDTKEYGDLEEIEYAEGQLYMVQKIKKDLLSQDLAVTSE